MCCFSQPVLRVAETRILSCEHSDGRQWTTYAMNVQASKELAMVLPLPVAAGTEQIEFVDLSNCPRFFVHLNKMFARQVEARSRGVARSSATKTSLAVHDVGEFEASFVPTCADFDRLDPRFVVPSEVWEQRPQYKDYGFAVFQLKGFGDATPRHKDVHPMSFLFPRRDPERLFFPTLHVHDGLMHSSAEFDHDLYAQVERDSMKGWMRSNGLVRDAGLPVEIESRLRGNRALFRKRMIGTYPNDDVTVLA